MRLHILLAFSLGTLAAVVGALSSDKIKANEWSPDENLATISSFASVSSAVSTKNPSLRVEVLGYPGTCSGTIVGPKMILTATHCFKDEGLPITFVMTTHGGAGVTVVYSSKEIISDGSDHSFILLDSPSNVFVLWATLGPDLVEGQNFEYWGNPAGLPGVYRRGYVVKRTDKELYLDVNGFHGDSGAGIFDERGRLVGMVSIITGVVSPQTGLSVKFMQSILFTYDKEKWARIAPNLGTPCQGCRTPNA